MSSEFIFWPPPNTPHNCPHPHPHSVRRNGPRPSRMPPRIGRDCITREGRCTVGWAAVGRVVQAGEERWCADGVVRVPPPPPQEDSSHFTHRRQRV
jgi:hypothetical protein